MGVAYFLLLCCLLAITAQVITAQGCSRPVPGDHMSLSDSDILLQTFPDGQKVSFTCDPGYISGGGSPTITCTAGSWSSVKLKCEKKSCGSAGDVTNGHIDYPVGTDFGDKAVITCDTGYMLVGKSEIYCGVQGWSGRLPVCEVVKCDPPPEIVNGAFSPVKEEYSYRDVVQYSCKKDYTLSGSTSTSCSEDGTFKPLNPPTCVMVQCENPDVVNGKWIDGARPPYGISSTVKLACESGYTMKGEQSQTCDINSKWSPGLPTCEPVKCPKPPMIVNGAFSPNNEEYSYKDVVQYSCNKDYTLSGSRSRTCSEDRTFTPDPPTCVRLPTTTTTTTTTTTPTATSKKPTGDGDSDSTPNGGHRTAVIVGVILGGILVVALCCCGCWYFEVGPFPKRKTQGSGGPL
uniref:Sushi domain-containing protein n=1 Tax=Anabas testudineus TaxID=64144 RepID=A0A3Q1JUM2_ANATE